MDDKIAAFWLNRPQEKKHFYDEYDYVSFWKGRDYEHQADQAAVRRLIKLIPPPHRQIIDIGGGFGRMAPLYKKIWGRSILLDPSKTQLEIAEKRLSPSDTVQFLQGSAESIPLPADSCDAALCIRTFHYVESPRRAIKEIARILAPGGHLILEIPNKAHAKARLAAFFSGRSTSSHDPISRSVERQDVPFLNHHPAAIQDVLLTEWFEIVEVLSVSNFRHAIFKKIFPRRTLVFFEKLLQRPLAHSWFGPSIYFLARKKVSA